MAAINPVQIKWNSAQASGVLTQIGSSQTMSPLTNGNTGICLAAVKKNPGVIAPSLVDDSSNAAWSLVAGPFPCSQAGWGSDGGALYIYTRATIAGAPNAVRVNFAVPQVCYAEMHEIPPCVFDQAFSSGPFQGSIPGAMVSPAFTPANADAYMVMLASISATGSNSVLLDGLTIDFDDAGSMVFGHKTYTTGGAKTTGFTTDASGGWNISGGIFVPAGAGGGGGGGFFLGRRGA